MAGVSARRRPPRKSPRALLVAIAATAVLLGGCGGDPESSFQITVEVHNDLTVIFTQELGEQPTAVTAAISNRGGRCDGLFGSSDNKALELHPTWSPDEDLTHLDAAIGAAHRYLEQRDGAEGRRTDADGNTVFASADTAGISFTPYETSGGGSADGAFIQSFSTVCADPETIDLADWETRVGGTDS